MFSPSSACLSALGFHSLIWLILFKFCIHMNIRGEWFGIVNGKISSIFDRVTCPPHIHSLFPSEWISNLVCALILWRSGLGCLMGKSHEFLIELSAWHTILAGYYRFKFLFFIIIVPLIDICNLMSCAIVQLLWFIYVEGVVLETTTVSDLV